MSDGKLMKQCFIHDFISSGCKQESGGVLALPSPSFISLGPLRSIFHLCPPSPALPPPIPHLFSDLSLEVGHLKS